MVRARHRPRCALTSWARRPGPPVATVDDGRSASTLRLRAPRAHLRAQGLLARATLARATLARATLVLVLTALAASCGSAPVRDPRRGTLSARRTSPAGPATERRCGSQPLQSPRVCAVATLDEEAGTLRVSLTIDPEALPDDRGELTARFREAELGDRFAQERVEVEDHPGWPTSLGAARQRVQLFYQVRLEQEGPPSEPGRSWRRPGGWHLVGTSFLPDLLVDGRRVAVPAMLVLDVGERPLWTAAGREDRVFVAPALSRLSEEAYEVGPLLAERRRAHSTTLWVGTSATGDEAAPFEETADVLSSAVARLENRLGPPSTDSMLIAYHLVGGPDAYSRRLGSSLVQALPPRAFADPRYGAVSAAMRELGHFWLPGSHAVRETWLAEGVAEYLTSQVLLELLGDGLDTLARVALSRHDAYARQAAGHRLLDPEAQRAPWVHDAGWVAGFCLDAHLRESGSSLWAVLRTTLARDEEELGTEALLADLAAVSASAASYLEALVGTEGAFAMDQCLERAGFHTRGVDFEAPADEALADALLRVGDVRPFTQLRAFEVRDVHEDSSFEEGDVIRSMAGRSVGDLADVAWALRDRAPGDEVEVELRRRGREVEVELVLPALDEPPVPRRRDELVPIE